MGRHVGQSKAFAATPSQRQPIPVNEKMPTEIRETTRYQREPLG